MIVSYNYYYHWKDFRTSGVIIVKIVKEVVSSYQIRLVLPSVA